MPFKFEKLEIWKLALNLANDVHLLTRMFPKEEMFSLTSQFKRAADSVVLNIAEGSIGQTNAEQKKFLSYAVRSISECVSCLYLSLSRNYINKEQFDSLYVKMEELFARTNKFRNSIAG